MREVEFFLCQLTLHVVAAASNVPQRPLRYEIVEETRSQTFVGAIKTDAGLSDKYSSDELRSLSLVMLTRDANTEYFSLDASDGVLRTAKVIDRDVICPQQVLCEISLEVAVQPRQYFESVKVIVKVIDMNDNAPMFTPQQTHLSLSEASMRGLVFPLTPARDPDSPKNGIERYELFGASDTFTLQVHTNQDGTKDLRLILSSVLDREVTDTYHLQVIAYDGGTPPLSGTQLIEVSVADVNDNSPVFKQSTYEIEVAEDMAVNSTLVRVQAEDADIGASGKVRYIFAHRTFLLHMEQFNLNPSTGELVLKKSLDYEGQYRLYNLDVFAQDSGTDSMPSPCKVIIHVTDVNDNAPTISITGAMGPTETGIVTVDEHADEGSFVAHISVSDADSGQNGQTTCGVQSVDFRLEKMLDKEYKLVTWSNIDREVRDRYELFVTCHDHGTPRQTSSAKIIVAVVDDNDHAPVFTSDLVAITIKENNRPGDFLTRLTATDRDSEANGELRYEFAMEPNLSGGSIVSNDDYSSFSIDSRTGVITANIALNREEKEQYTLRVQARDQSAKPRYAMALVTVTVVDEDDSSPQFTMKRYDFEMYENDEPVKIVGEVIAFDADLPPYNTFTYHIDEQQPDGGVFKIDPDNGKITTTKSLNREEKDKYEFQVTVRSRVSPHMADSATVCITVLDVNDNSPKVTFPDGVNNTFYVSNKLPPGYPAVTIQARDADVGLNAELTFALTDVTNVPQFVIDPKSGEIIVNKDLSDYDSHVFRLEIIVSDRGQPPQSTITRLNIVVNRAMAYVDARRDALSALAFSSNQVTIMVLVIIGCVIFAICLLLAVLVVRRRDAHVKALHAATSVRANSGAGNGAVLASPRKSSLTIANLNANSMQLTQASENIYSSMPKDNSYPNSLCGLSQASEDDMSFTMRPPSVTGVTATTPTSPGKYTSLMLAPPYDCGSDSGLPFTDWLRSENFQLQQQGHTYRVNETPAMPPTGTLKKSVRFQNHSADTDDDSSSSILLGQQQQQQSSTMPLNDAMLTRGCQPQQMQQPLRDGSNRLQPQYLSKDNYNENGRLPSQYSFIDSNGSLANGCRVLPHQQYPLHPKVGGVGIYDGMDSPRKAALSSQLSPRLALSSGENGMMATDSFPPPPKLALETFMSNRIPQGNSVV